MTDTLINQFYGLENYFFSRIGTAVLNLYDNVKAYVTDVKSENLNFLALREVPDDLQEIFDATLSFFQRHHCPWIIVVPEAIFTAKLAQYFSEKNFSFQEKTQAMYCDLNKINLMANGKYDIIQMNDNLYDWSFPLMEAFESNIDISNQYLVAHQRAIQKKANFWHFSIYHQNKPIASITLSIVNSIARIDDLGTIPSFQKQGYATALLKYCLSFAKAQKASVCFLEASEAGINIYEKLNFKPLFSNLLFHQIDT